MAKTDAIAAPEILPPAMMHDAKKLGAVQRIEALKALKEMTEHKRDLLVNETRQLGAAIMIHKLTGCAVGYHLSRIKDLTAEEWGLYGKIRKEFKISQRQAERVVEGYENAAAQFPLPVLRELLTRGLDIVARPDKGRPLGQLTHIIRDNPVPRAAHTDPEAARRVVDQWEQTLKEKRSRARKMAGKAEVEHGDPTELIGNILRAYQRYYRQFPSGEKRKFAYVEKVIGKIMQVSGITSKRTFEPEALTDEEQLKAVGRPQLVEGESSAASA